MLRLISSIVVTMVLIIPLSAEDKEERECKLVKGKCSCCIEDKEKSKVYPGGCSSTLMARSSYYDEEGCLHYHDPNYTTCYYSCSRGHKWSQILPKSPCLCGDYP